MRTEVCTPWATELDIPANCDRDGINPADLEFGIRWATEILFNLTGRRWPGTCHDEVSPWIDCHSGFNGCAHTSIDLPSARVIQVNDVFVNGVSLDPTAYEVRDGHRLIRRDGESWPCTLTSDDPRVRILYEWGAAPPATAVKMAAILGYEIASAITPACADRCRLPKNAQTIARAGITISTADPGQMFRDGRVGIPEIDLWLGALRIGDQVDYEIVVPGQPGPSRTY